MGGSPAEREGAAIAGAVGAVGVKVHGLRRIGRNWGRSGMFGEGELSRRFCRIRGLLHAGQFIEGLHGERVWWPLWAGVSDSGRCGCGCAGVILEVECVKVGGLIDWRLSCRGSTGASRDGKVRWKVNQQLLLLCIFIHHLAKKQPVPSMEQTAITHFDYCVSHLQLDQ